MRRTVRRVRPPSAWRDVEGECITKGRCTGHGHDYAVANMYTAINMRTGPAAPPHDSTLMVSLFRNCASFSFKKASKVCPSRTIGHTVMVAMTPDNAVPTMSTAQARNAMPMGTVGVCRAPKSRPCATGARGGGCTASDGQPPRGRGVWASCFVGGGVHSRIFPRAAGTPLCTEHAVQRRVCCVCAALGACTHARRACGVVTPQQWPLDAASRPALVPLTAPHCSTLHTYNVLLTTSATCTPWVQYQPLHENARSHEHTATRARRCGAHVAPGGRRHAGQ